MSDVLMPHHGTTKNMNDKECKEFLGEHVYGHLGCIDDDGVYVVPTSFVFDNGSFYLHSPLGKKIYGMRDNSEICIQSEEVLDFFHWKSGIAWGKYQELEGEEADRAMRLLMQKVSLKEGARRVSSLVTNLAAEMDKAIVFKVKATKITGRREG
jgi:nitroimidazol reductase NimA-like FMN-containing flavoprotein (pyridoxamine 5'-phosphate oxidase superfamily)